MEDRFDVDSKKVAKAKADQKNEAQADLQTLLSTYVGRRFYWELLVKCDISSQTYAGEYTHETAFREGRRSVGLDYWGDLFALDPTIYITMKNEANEREK